MHCLLTINRYLLTVVVNVHQCYNLSLLELRFAFEPFTLLHTSTRSSNFVRTVIAKIECGMHQIIGGFHGGYLLGIKDLGTIYH